MLGVERKTVPLAHLLEPPGERLVLSISDRIAEPWLYELDAGRRLPYPQVLQ
jgi:hypothetical protein